GLRGRADALIGLRQAARADAVLEARPFRELPLGGRLLQDLRLRAPVVEPRPQPHGDSTVLPARGVSSSSSNHHASEADAVSAGRYAIVGPRGCRVSAIGSAGASSRMTISGPAPRLVSR